MAATNATDTCHSIATGHALRPEKLEKLSEKVKQLRTRAMLLRGKQRAEICGAAGHSDLDALVATIKSNANRRKRLNNSSSDIVGTPSAVRRHRRSRRLYITSHPRDEAHRLSHQQVVRLDSFMRRRPLNEIELAEAELLVNAVGQSVVSMQPGGDDLSDVDMPHHLGEYIMGAKSVLYPEGGLRCVHSIALAKLVSLRIGPNENFMFELFGLLMRRDLSEAPRKAITIKASTREMHAQKAKDDLLCPVQSIHDLEAVMQGLTLAVEHLLQPSILSGIELRMLASTIRSACDDYGARTQMMALYSAYKTRLSEHAMAVRACKAPENAARSLPALTTRRKGHL